MMAYSPKATVQAAIGGLPLAMGLACGNIVLTVSVEVIVTPTVLLATSIAVAVSVLLKIADVLDCNAVVDFSHDVQGHFRKLPLGLKVR